MEQPSVLQDSVLFRTALDLYRAHQPASSGQCGYCRGFGCAARRNAVEVIQAAGVDPAGFVVRGLAHSWWEEGTVRLPEQR